MKLVLMGTSSWTIPVFDRIADEHDVVAVFTRAPAPAGRKQVMTKSPVHDWAESRGIRVLTDIGEFTSGFGESYNSSPLGLGANNSPFGLAANNSPLELGANNSPIELGANNSPLGGSRRSPGAHRRDGRAGGGTSSVGDTVCPPTDPSRQAAPRSTPPKGGVVATPRIDYIIVASYGVILRDDVLNAAPCVNIHPSSLPKYRGASPMLTAIWNGDTESEVCLMKVTAAVDAGDVFMRRPFAIGENDTITDVERSVGEISSDMISEFLRAPEKYPPTPQTGTPTYTRKFKTADEIIDWSRTPREIHNQIRSIGGRTKINGIDVKILETRVGAYGIRPENDPQGEWHSPLQIITVQPSGKKPMPWRDFVNGQRGKVVFGS